MSRPAVSVVMPFAGSRLEADSALAALRALSTGPGDELILADNAGVAPADDRVTVVPASGEQSPSHARNAGAARASRPWILFLDADCTAPADLLDRFFARDVGDDVGALAGAVVAATGSAGSEPGLAERYGAAKSFLDQDAHLAHSFMPRAVAANLLVRREAFEAIGGFYEGVRAAEDTDFSWRLQRAGWRLEGRSDAVVEHRYRTTVRALRRQWRGYAAGRAWLGRRYDGFSPEPALVRAGRRVVRRGSARPVAASGTAPSSGTGPSSSTAPGRLDRGRFLALDALLGVEELAGFALSNRPRRAAGAPARVVLVADRFPARDDPLADFALTLAGARVEAAARPEALGSAAHRLTIDYREDDGAGARALAVARLLARHPLRSARDLLGRRPGAPTLAALAPAAVRLTRDGDARVHPLGGEEPRAVAARLARLAGRRLEV
ncbi:MAG TPA: glycosyltransferase family 2 protein [Solirubrobacteraceae bacterium]|nr:glycosyltransferase family 2 protein [Solirubrobacteraceae bacterium]